MPWSILRPKTTPRASSGSSPTGSEGTESEPPASAMRWSSSRLEAESREVSRTSGRPTSARAACEGASMRFPGSTRMPMRLMSELSSDSGSARRMTSRRRGEPSLPTSWPS